MFDASLRCTKHNTLQYIAIRHLLTLIQCNSNGVKFGIELGNLNLNSLIQFKLNCIELELNSSNSTKKASNCVELYSTHIHAFRVLNACVRVRVCKCTNVCEHE